MSRRNVHVSDKLLKTDETCVDKRRGIKIFSLNCYMVSDLALSAYERQFCCEKAARAQRIGQFASQYDVIALQEVWGDSLWSLERELIDSHVRAFHIYTYSSSLLNVASRWWKGTGGLWLAARRTLLPVLATHRLQFNHSQTRSGKGSSYMLLDAKTMWIDESYLLIINTHLDPTNENHSQEIQLHEIVLFIGEALRKVRNLVGSLNKVALLLCGDFNINGKSQREYQLITNGLGNHVRDLALEWASSQNQSVKSTFSNYYSDGSINKYHAWNGSQRLDYFFTFDSFEFDGSQVDLMSIGGSVTVHDSPDCAFSDHFGLTCELFPIHKDNSFEHFKS